MKVEIPTSASALLYSTSYTWKVPYVRKKAPTPCPKFVGWNRATAPSLLHRERFKCCCVYDLRKFWILLVLGQERFIYRGKVICHFFFLLLGYFCLFRLGSSQLGTMRWLILLYCVFFNLCGCNSKAQMLCSLQVRQVVLRKLTVPFLVLSAAVGCYNHKRIHGWFMQRSSSCASCSSFGFWIFISLIFVLNNSCWGLNSWVSEISMRRQSSIGFPYLSFWNMYLWSNSAPRL